MIKINKYCVVAVLLMMTVAGCNEQQVSSNKNKTLLLAAIRTIEEALDSSDPRIRTNAIEAVVNTRHVNLMPKVAKLLKDDFVPVRFSAAVAVGDMNYRLAADHVTKLLQDPDINVKTAAAYAVGKLGLNEYYKIIKEAARNKDQTVRANAVWLLGKSGDEANLKMLNRIRDKDEARNVSYFATRSIAMLGDETIYPKIWTMLISAYIDDRMLGVEIMGELGRAHADGILTRTDKEVEGALISMLDDDVINVRLAAAGQLGMLGNYTGQAEVLDVFRGKAVSLIDKSDYEGIYMLASLAIGNIATEELNRYLPQLLRNDSQIVRIAAAQAVLKCSNKK